MDAVDKEALFERMPLPKAVLTLSIPTIVSSLVMVIYNLSDTYFVGMLDDPIQNAAVTLAAPLLLAFNAVNNLFGVGSSSMRRSTAPLPSASTARCCAAGCSPWDTRFSGDRCWRFWAPARRPWRPPPATFSGQ